MAIVNRSKDESERFLPFNLSFGSALTNGETGIIGYVPFPCSISEANIATFSLAGSPYILLTVSRFIAGAGVTTINIGSTFAMRDFGVSGVLSAGVSLPAAGVNLMANDVLGYVVGGGATLAAFGAAGCVVLNPAQDVKSYL